MLQIAYKPSFIKQLNKLENDLQDEALEKIEQFKDIKNHRALNVHKLHGPLKDYFGFYVNYKIRIVFRYETKNEAILMRIGDHDAYK